MVTFLGTAAPGVITRIIGLIPASIGVEMLTEEIQAAFHLTA